MDIEDFYKAFESLKKANVPMTNLVAVQAPIESDTYTLIPNGTEITKKQGSHGKEIRAYLVQHDQSGLTIKWQGASEMWYYQNTCVGDAFRTFSGWSKKKREKWYANEYQLITKEERQMQYIDDFDCLCAPVSCTPISLSTIGYAKPTSKSYAKKENTMNIAASTTIAATPTDQRQRDYLLGRLESISYDKHSGFYKHFKLDPVEFPKTFKELVEKIKADDFFMEEKRMDQKMSIYSIMDYVRWTKDKPDQAGYDKACEELKKAQQATKDLIIISEPKDGLKALNDFEAKTFH